MEERIEQFEKELEDMTTAANRLQRQKKVIEMRNERIEGENERLHAALRYCFAQIQKLSGLLGVTKSTQTENI